MRFGTAAFRAGHSMVSSTVARKLASGAGQETRLPRALFRPVREFNAGGGSGGPEPLLHATTTRVARNVDLVVVPGLRDVQFRFVEEMHAFDLVALNIQRGRDHGLPNDNYVRRGLGLRAARTSRDTARKDAGVRHRLAEPHAAGFAVGATMRANWVGEFRRLRDGNARFFQRRSALDVLALGTERSLHRLRGQLASARRRSFGRLVARREKVSVGQRGEEGGEMTQTCCI